MKKIQLKIWPEITDYLPALIPFKNIGNRLNDIYIDLSNCHDVNSSGLNILLMRVLRIIKFDTRKRSWISDITNKNQILSKITGLNFFNILHDYNEQLSIFSPIKKDESCSDPLQQSNSNAKIIMSYPLFLIDYRNYDENRRKAIRYFREWLYSTLITYYDEYDFNFTQLIAVLTEMAKNSADHTDDNAFFGLDIVINERDKRLRLLFSFCDLGIGIKRNIQEHLEKRIYEKRYKHWGIAETYYRALQPGITTKPSSIDNKGFGMSIILDGAKGIDLRLSVFDVASRGILSDINERSHSEIRKNFYYTGKDIGFFYFGEMNAEGIK